MGEMVPGSITVLPTPVDLIESAPAASAFNTEALDGNCRAPIIEEDTYYDLVLVT